MSSTTKTVKKETPPISRASAKPGSDQLRSFDFLPVFEALPGLLLVLNTDLRVVAVNDAYLEATETVREDIVGKRVLDVFPECQDKVEDTRNRQLLRSLEAVIRDRRPDTMSVQKVTVPQFGAQGGGVAQRFWTPTNVPVFGDDGEVAFVVVNIEDVTEFLQIKEAAGNQEGSERHLRESSDKMHSEVMLRSHEIRKVNQDLAATVQALRLTEEEARVLSEDLLTTNVELKIAKEAAESANAAKTEFLSRMSHELRTPLNSVLGFAQLLEMQHDDPGIREPANSILRAGKHLLALINEVLELSKIETERMSVLIEDVRVSDVVGHALDLLVPITAGSGISVSVEPEDLDDFHVRGDRQRLLQVLINVLNNAVKYNRKGGSVQLCCVKTPTGTVRIEITDEGGGISDTDRKLLFQPFQRFGDLTVEGTGLGLVLSRRFVDLMGGTLDLAQSGPTGSTFFLELEASEGAEPNSAYLLRERMAPYLKLGSTRKVLYIEDNLANMRLLELAFEHLPDVRLIPAVQGSIGIELAREHKPDLILLDLHLPDTSGDIVLFRLKNDPLTASIPVIIVTAEATTTERERLLSLGATDYMTKPLDLRQLLQVVRFRLGLDDEVVDPDSGPRSPLPRGSGGTTNNKS